MQLFKRFFSTQLEVFQTENDKILEIGNASFQLLWKSLVNVKRPTLFSKSSQETSNPQMSKFISTIQEMWISPIFRTFISKSKILQFPVNLSVKIFSQKQLATILTFVDFVTEISLELKIHTIIPHDLLHHMHRLSLIVSDTFLAKVLQLHVDKYFFFFGFLHLENSWIFPIVNY
jgi:hypothetical protein